MAHPTDFTAGSGELIFDFRFSIEKVTCIGQKAVQQSIGGFGCNLRRGCYNPDFMGNNDCIVAGHTEGYDFAATLAVRMIRE
jgi:hypothetical protein